MSGRVPIQRYEPVNTPVLIGAPVSSGATWLPMVHLANWLSGSGAQLVPTVIIDKTIASGSTGVMHFRAKTRAQAIERVWCLMLRGATSATTVVIKAPTSTGTASPATSVTSGRDTRLPIVYREILSAKASAVTDLTIEITATGGDVEIDSISCTELARPLLNQDGDDFGVDTESLRPRERIYESPGGWDSVPGVIASSVGSDPRRVGIFHWSVPDTQPITTTAAYANVLTLAMPVLARRLLSTGTTATVYWSAYAMAAGGKGGDGDVLITTTQSMVSDPVNVTAGALAWTTARAISISCEDMTAADGRQSTAWDDLQIQFRGNGGATLSLAAVSVWDEAT